MSAIPTYSEKSARMAMLAYYLRLGLRSLRKNPVLTGLMVLAIGFGVAASMTTYAVFRAVSGDPIPQKSSQLYTYQIDSWGPQRFHPGRLPEALSYIDAMALLREHHAPRQTFLYPLLVSVLPRGEHGLPQSIDGFAVTADFFTMFDVPMLYGGGWSQAEDDARADVVVISDAFNQRYFGGANSVGHEITLNGRDFRVAGVLRRWNPQPRFFAVWGDGAFNEPADFYIPLQRAIDMKLDTAGSNSCRSSADSMNGWNAWLQSNCVWLTPWVELDTAAQASDFHSYLQAYAAEQQRAGRFNWAPRTALYDVMGWLDYEEVVPPESRISLIVATGFFLICLVNTIGLLLAKFMRRSSEIGVRRALGATRQEIYSQYLMEAGAVGLAGGMLGLALTWLGTLGVGLLFEPDVAALAHMDASLVGLTLGVAVAATIAAAFYPAWRAAQVQPAWQLKSN